ncbi:MAG: YajQ family cyclic di-GMP-binding protein [Bacteroidota bacterium]
MASFDITSKVDLQTLDNSINIARKEIENRYDFKGSKITVELDKKNMLINLEVENDMQLQQVEDILLTKAMRQGLESKSFDLTEDHAGSGKYLRKTIKVKNGIDRDNAKKIIKLIKDGCPKVQPAIMDDIIRVSGKKLDDLQEAIHICRTSAIDLPLQFVNMKS